MSALRGEDFTFIGHGMTDRKFQKHFGYLEVFSGRPEFSSLENVLYTPASNPASGSLGALFQEDGDRIDSALQRAGRFDALKTDEAEQKCLDKAPVIKGEYLYLGSFAPHFGHFITETLARFWAISEPALADLKLLAHVPDPAMFEWPYVKSILGYLGLSPEDVVFFDRPVRLESVVVPSAALDLERRAYEAIKEPFRRIANSAMKQPIVKTEQPLYLSRANLKKGVYNYHNQKRIESLLSERGVKIISPEQHTISEQVEFLNKHTNIIGVIGSGMHNTLLSIDSPNLYYFTPNWINPTCFLLDSVIGANSIYIQVCHSLDAYQDYARRIAKKFGIRSKRINNFHFHRNIDEKKVLNWVSRSDLFN